MPVHGSLSSPPQTTVPARVPRTATARELPSEANKLYRLPESSVNRLRVITAAANTCTGLPNGQSDKPIAWLFLSSTLEESIEID